MSKVRKVISVQETRLAGKDTHKENLTALEARKRCFTVRLKIIVTPERTHPTCTQTRLLEDRRAPVITLYELV